MLGKQLTILNKTQPYIVVYVVLTLFFKKIPLFGQNIVHRIGYSKRCYGHNFRNIFQFQFQVTMTIYTYICAFLPSYLHFNRTFQTLMKQLLFQLLDGGEYRLPCPKPWGWFSRGSTHWLNKYQDWPNNYFKIIGIHLHIQISISRLNRIST
jgi:hypothetical protein